MISNGTHDDIKWVYCVWEFRAYCGFVQRRSVREVPEEIPGISGITLCVRSHIELRDPKVNFRGNTGWKSCVPSTLARRNVRRVFEFWRYFTKHEDPAWPSRLCVDTHACARTSRESDGRKSVWWPGRDYARRSQHRVLSSRKGSRSGRRTRAAALSAPLFGAYRSALSPSLLSLAALSHTPLARDVASSRCSANEGDYTTTPSRRTHRSRAMSLNVNLDL